MSSDGLSSSSPPLKGRCKWFNFNKGYGFIERPGADDLFVHYKNIHHSRFRVLHTGEPVEFRIRSYTVTGRAEAVNVTGPGGSECSGQLLAARKRRTRCYNCGQFAEHLAVECPEPQRAERSCHFCQSAEHRRSECPMQKSAVALRAPPATVVNDSGCELDTSADSESAICCDSGEGVLCGEAIEAE